MIKALVPGAIIDADAPAAESATSGYAPKDAQNGSGCVDPSEMTSTRK